MMMYRPQHMYFRQACVSLSQQHRAPMAARGVANQRLVEQHVSPESLSRLSEKKKLESLDCHLRMQTEAPGFFL